MGMIPKLSEIKDQIEGWSPVARLIFFTILIYVIYRVWLFWEIFWYEFNY
jgi:hypothetical protein